MGRLIDADDAIKLLRGKCVAKYPTTFLVGLFAAADELSKLPEVDAVPVVRCKECEHWHEETGWCDEHSHFTDSDGAFCHPYESSDWKMFDADYFCADGERKDND